MRRFRRKRTSQKFVCILVRNLLNMERHLYSQGSFKCIRAAALAGRGLASAG